MHSCWSVYFEDIALLQMCSSTQRKRERERRAGAKEQQKDVSDRRFGGGCQVGLIMVYFMTRTFKALRGRRPGDSGRNALSRDNTGNKHKAQQRGITSTDPDKSPREAKK